LLILILFLLIGFSCTSPDETMAQSEIIIHPLRLVPGQDLKEAIDAYVKTKGIEAGWIMTCVGSLTDWHIRFANQPEGAAGKGHFEIVSLVGTVGTAGSHIHLSISDSLGQTTGGHLLPGNLVYTTAEIVIGESKRHIFAREEDGTTPFKELQIKEKK
jgi:hypothetical protein